jgi:hypothetical protein
VFEQSDAHTDEHREPNADAVSECDRYAHADTK